MAESKNRKNYYEAMFLISPSVATDLGGAIQHIREILGRGDVELISLRKWDERRLAYEIQKNKRGVYILAYFAADPSRLALIERACNLSEQLLRSLIIRADHLTLEEMQAADGQAELATEIELRKARMAEEREEAASPAESSSAS